MESTTEKYTENGKQIYAKNDNSDDFLTSETCTDGIKFNTRKHKHK